MHMSDELDIEGDICQRCRHVLHGDGCPQCGWTREHVDAEIPPRPRNEPPGIRGW